LETGVRGQIGDVVAAIVQVVAAAPDRAHCGVAGGDAGKGDGLLRLGCGLWSVVSHSRTSLDGAAPLFEGRRETRDLSRPIRIQVVIHQTSLPVRGADTHRPVGPGLPVRDRRGPRSTSNHPMTSNSTRASPDANVTRSGNPAKARGPACAGIPASRLAPAHCHSMSTLRYRPNPAHRLT